MGLPHESRQLEQQPCLLSPAVLLISALISFGHLISAYLPAPSGCGCPGGRSPLPGSVRCRGPGCSWEPEPSWKRSPPGLGSKAGLRGEVPSSLVAASARPARASPSPVEKKKIKKIKRVLIPVVLSSFCRRRSSRCRSLARLVGSSSARSLSESGSWLCCSQGNICKAFEALEKQKVHGKTGSPGIYYF